jgi:hypothetical protein
LDKQNCTQPRPQNNFFKKVSPAMPGNVGSSVTNSQQLYQEGVPDPIRSKPPFSAALQQYFAKNATQFSFRLPLYQENGQSELTGWPNPAHPSAKCLSAFQFFNSSTFHLSFAGRMTGAHSRSDAPWYRELNIMNRVLNKDNCPEPFQYYIERHFSDVFNPASCMQDFLYDTGGTILQFTGPQPHRSRSPRRDFGGLMHDK